MSAPIPQAAFQNGADGREVLNRSEAVWTQKEKEYAVGGFLAGMTYAEIADELGRSRSSVAGQIRRMREGKNSHKVPPALSQRQAAKAGDVKHLNRVADLLADGF
jgi:IS30 family transposase